MFILSTSEDYLNSPVMFGTVALQYKTKLTWKQFKRWHKKIVLIENFKSYEHALNYLDLDTLKKRRTDLSTKFARKFIKTKKIQYIFYLTMGFIQ